MKMNGGKYVVIFKHYHKSGHEESNCYQSVGYPTDWNQRKCKE